MYVQFPWVLTKFSTNFVYSDVVVNWTVDDNCEPEVCACEAEAMTRGLMITPTIMINDKIVAERSFLGGMAKSACKLR